MKLNLDDLNPGSWFYFDDNKPEEGRICLRIMNSDALKEIEAKAVKRKVEYKKGQRYEFSEINNELYEKLRWDYTIVDWENLTDTDGNLLECNADMKMRVVSGDPKFLAFIANCLQQIADDLDTILEDQERD
jgi:hypothetical protein